MDFIPFALIVGACCLWLCIGTLRLVSWVLERRDAALIRQIEREAVVALGHMEMQRIYAREREVFNDSFD
ncbi:hypothetical protein [Xanthomonas vesicatoria]|uniref:Uncharacterized protein n=1 Tax=Xanthomonas vesicatoria TaxID=56460 RepID=A0ABS8LD70_9XANT|nr:hypothetical protein [Xanthomonas vesicatoria]MCC8623135.1 hypothetical protein [Xanthomonas vesicatoria]